jgi:hypothetical protein
MAKLSATDKPDEAQQKLKKQERLKTADRAKEYIKQIYQTLIPSYQNTKE